MPCAKAQVTGVKHSGAVKQAYEQKTTKNAQMIKPAFFVEK